MRRDLFAKLYCILTFLSLFLLVLVTFKNQGVDVKRYFFNDTLDTGMDFFNSVLYTKGAHPYTEYRTIYPPLANFIFWIIYRCTPESLSANWPGSLSEGVAMRGTMMDLRVAQVPLLAFMIMIMIATFLFVFVVSFAYKNSRLGMIMGVALLFSFGSLYSFERGNIIILAIAFLFVFLVFFDSDNKFLREVAIISLAISAGIKLYPALFGVMILFKRDWKQAVRAIIYGALLFFVPFCLFDGVAGFLEFWDALFGFSTKDVSLRITGYNLERILCSLVYQRSIVQGWDYNLFMEGAFPVVAMLKRVIMIGLLVAIMGCKERWKKYLALGLIILNIQDSGGYTLLFLLPAVIELGKESKQCVLNWVYFIVLCVICLPLPIMGYLELLGMNKIVFVKQYALFAIHFLLIGDLIVTLLSKMRKIRWRKVAIEEKRATWR